MAGVVAGYAKTHYYLGSPEMKNLKRRKRVVKKILPSIKSKHLQVLK
jgi:hypothetical protein